MIDSLVIAFANLFLTVLSLYKWIIIISALLSWVQPDPSNPIVQMLYRLTEPAYAFVRRLIPTTIAGMDMAPMILVFSIIFIETFFSNFLRGLL